VDSIPAMGADARQAAGFAWEELFSAEIRNPHTRRAYRHAVRPFLAWCEAKAVCDGKASKRLITSSM
jgi:hypothetical protein